MKKSLIALAVLASVAGVAQAQSSVQLYGIVDMSLQKFKNNSAKLESGAVSGSRWGLKGSEDLGGGLKANFLLEQGFSADTGTAATVTTPAGTVVPAAFARQSYVGLSGGFGEIKLGNVFTAYDDISGATNPVFDSALSPTGVFKSTKYNSNPSNNFYYASPSFGGVSGAVSYSLDETNGVDTGVMAFHAKYEGGPIYAGFAYQTEGVVGASDNKYTRINGSYDMGVAKLLAGYGKVEKAGVVGDFTEYTIGADIPVGSAMVASLGYANSNPKAAGANQTSYSAGVAYSLSKRTTTYGGFVKTNKAAGDVSGFAVGLKHTF